MAAWTALWCVSMMGMRFRGPDALPDAVNLHFADMMICIQHAVKVSCGVGYRQGRSAAHCGAGSVSQLDLTSMTRL